MSRLDYRPEIDGLRAVAVIPVILFHAGLSIFKGGYVGVDIFFVISGYLITSILLSELESGDYSIPRFYERRARRILPALFFVIVCCIPFAWMWMLPSELERFSKSIVSVVLFISNIQFWREEGYFAPEVDLKPLLHTWSLAVEEQYYLLFPLFLLATWRLGRRRVFWLICAVAALSLLISEWGWRHEPTANFYLAPTRAWELLAGSICAFWLRDREQRTSNWLSAAGLGLIVFAILIYDDAVPFPSTYALVPVLGTALIILFGGAGTWTASLLRTRAFVGVGLISYSAYLWHQPLFAFARIRSFTEPSTVLMIALAALSLILAHFSWRYIEKPFRNGQRSILPTRRGMFAASGVIGALFIGLGVAGSVNDGFASRSREGASLGNLEERLTINYGLSEDCEDGFNHSANCMTASHPNVLLWGDSFAMHLAQGILASEPNIRLQQETMSVCAPIIGVAPIDSAEYPEKWSRKCIAFNDDVVKFISQHHEFDLVILSSPFSMVEGDFMTRDGHVHKPDEVAILHDELIKTANAIRAIGPRVIIVSPTPRSGWNNGLCAARASIANWPDEVCNFALDMTHTPFVFLHSLLGEVPVFWLTNEICSKDVCRPKRGDLYIYRDEGHLSKEGSAYLGKTYSWMKQLRALAR
ncbi:MAG: acyltransferase [Phenylobacterium sp.]|uniref:acyltransferase family protein n=1 Tax=Phenylobacterium sp. TaxID=1871053 RepID=UPI0025D88034|nr:acyltransferase family protein [Phenylobacterium sp.]MBA4013868.1 acyltransferase [Phenylobacterium sp.]